MHYGTLSPRVLPPDGGSFELIADVPGEIWNLTAANETDCYLNFFHNCSKISGEICRKSNTLPLKLVINFHKPIH